MRVFSLSLSFLLSLLILSAFGSFEYDFAQL